MTLLTLIGYMTENDSERHIFFFRTYTNIVMQKKTPGQNPGAVPLKRGD